MKNIIEELRNDERCPQDTPVDNNPHYKELQHLQSRNKTELLESLSGEQKEKLKKYCDNTLEMNAVSEREAFVSGHRIALRLACAALSDKKKMPHSPLIQKGSRGCCCLATRPKFGRVTAF